MRNKIQLSIPVRKRLITFLNFFLFLLCLLTKYQHYGVSLDHWIWSE